MSNNDADDLFHSSHHIGQHQAYSMGDLQHTSYPTVSPFHPIDPQHQSLHSSPDSPFGVSPYSTSSISTPIIFSHTSPPPTSLYSSTTPPLAPAVNVPDIPPIPSQYHPPHPSAYHIQPSTPNPTAFPQANPPPATSEQSHQNTSPATPSASNASSMSQHHHHHHHHQIPHPTAYPSTLPCPEDDSLQQQQQQHPITTSHDVTASYTNETTPAVSNATSLSQHHDINDVHHHPDIPQHILHALQKKVMVDDRDLVSSTIHADTVPKPPSNRLHTHTLPPQTPKPVYTPLNTETTPFLRDLMEYVPENERDIVRQEFNQRLIEQKHIHFQARHLAKDSHTRHTQEMNEHSSVSSSSTTITPSPPRRLHPKVFEIRAKQPFALHDACEIGDVDFLTTLFTYNDHGEKNDVWKSMNFNQRDIDNLTPLHICVINGRLKCLQLLLQYGDVDLSLRVEGVPLLMFLLSAIGAFPIQFYQFGRKAMQLLLSHEIPPDLFKCDDLKQCVLHTCAQYDLDYYASIILHEVHTQHHITHVDWLNKCRINAYDDLQRNGLVDPCLSGLSTPPAVSPATPMEGDDTHKAVSAPSEMVVPKHARIFELLLKQDNMKRTPLHVAAQNRSYRVLRVFVSYIIQYYPLLPIYMRKVMRLAYENGDNTVTPAAIFYDRYHRTPLHYVYYYGQSSYDSLSSFLNEDPCTQYLHEMENAIRSSTPSHQSHSSSDQGELDSSCTFVHMIPLLSQWATSKPSNDHNSPSQWKFFTYSEVFNLVFGCQSSLDAYGRTPSQLAMVNAGATTAHAPTVQPPTLISWSPRCFEHHTASRITRKDPSPPPENVRRLQVLLNYTNGAIRSNEFNHNFEQLGVQYLTRILHRPTGEENDPFLSQVYGVTTSMTDVAKQSRLFQTKKRSVVWEHRAKRAELADVLKCHDFGYIYKLLESVELVSEQSDWLVYTNQIVDILQRDISSLSLSSSQTSTHIDTLNRITNILKQYGQHDQKMDDELTFNVHAGHLTAEKTDDILRRNALVNQTSVVLPPSTHEDMDTVPLVQYDHSIHPSTLTQDNFPIAHLQRHVDHYNDMNDKAVVVKVDMTPVHFTNRLIQSNRLVHTIHHYTIDGSHHDEHDPDKMLTFAGEVSTVPSTSVTIYQPSPIPLVHLDADTALSSFSFLAALHAAGTVIDAVTKVCMGINLNAFCAVRPPGHHSGPNGIVAPDTKVTTGGEGAPPTSNGFCLINNVAIAAAYAKSHFRNIIKRVAIVDIDVHHGNGTEAIVRSLKPSVHTATISNSEMEHLVDTINVQRRVCRLWNDVTDVDDVMFASVHGYTTDDNWFYPGTGETTPGIVELINQRNTDPSRIIGDFNPYSTKDTFGAVDEVYEATRETKKRPKELQQLLVRQYQAMIQQGSMLPGTVHNNSPTLTNLMSRNSRVINAGVGQQSRNAWKRVWQHVIIPGIVAHKPDLILISAGFDAHQRDDMNSGYIGIDEDDYYWITRELVKVANLTCSGRVVSVLEGGYRIHGGLVSPFSRSVSAHIRALNEGGHQKWDPHDSHVESQIDLEIDRRRNLARLQQRQRHIEMVRKMKASRHPLPSNGMEAVPAPGQTQGTAVSTSTSASPTTHSSSTGQDGTSAAGAIPSASAQPVSEPTSGRPSRRVRQKVDYAEANKRLTEALTNQKRPRFNNADPQTTTTAPTSTIPSTDGAIPPSSTSTINNTPKQQDDNAKPSS